MSLTVDFTRGKFVIIANKVDVGAVANLPNRRFNKNRGIWTAPPVRLNLISISKWDATFSQTAKAVLDAYEEEKNDKKEPFPEGYKFKTEPRDYQRNGLDTMWGVKYGALFMDPGTGKTKISIDLSTARFIMGQIEKVLVIGLVSIKRNWADEIEKHCPIPHSSHILETKVAGKKRFAKWSEDKSLFQWLIVGVESFSAGSAYKLIKDYVDDKTLIIVDESSRIKNHKAKRTERVVEIGLETDYKMILTGTPVTQGAGDLFSQYEFLNDDIIGVGDYYSFRNRYCVMGGFEAKQVIGYQRMDELVEAVKPYTFQVRKREVLPELPDFTKEVRIVQMTAEQSKLYKELKDTLRLQYMDKKLTVMNVMNQMQRFGEITGGHVSYSTENPDPFTREKKPIIYKRVQLNRAPKLEELMCLIEEFPDDEPVIIWTPDRSEIERIYEKLAKVYGGDQIGVMAGSTKEDKRDEYVKRFQANDLRFIVGNPLVGGIGINLTAARYMVYYNRDFSLESTIQSEARIDRIGQLRGMTYYDIVCGGTIDEYKLKVLNDKNDFAETIRNSIDDGSFLDLI